MLNRLHNTPPGQKTMTHDATVFDVRIAFSWKSESGPKPRTPIGVFRAARLFPEVSRHRSAGTVSAARPKSAAIKASIRRLLLQKCLYGVISNGVVLPYPPMLFLTFAHDTEYLWHTHALRDMWYEDDGEDYGMSLIRIAGLMSRLSDARVNGLSQILEWLLKSLSYRIDPTVFYHEKYPAQYSNEWYFVVLFQLREIWLRRHKLYLPSERGNDH